MSGALSGHDRQRAVVFLAEHLREGGWTIYGYHGDKSDLMTDYYQPESWDGVAERGGYVLVADRTENRGSGGRPFHDWENAWPCLRCRGTGYEPKGWTLQEARERPADFNGDRIAICNWSSHRRGAA